MMAQFFFEVDVRMQIRMRMYAGVLITTFPKANSSYMNNLSFWLDVVAEGGEFQLDLLINNLRNDLRKELNLEMVSGNVRWLRFNRSN
jgi:hypothetical protein